MQRCADALKGSCSYAFHDDKTVCTLICPARLVNNPYAVSPSFSLSMQVDIMNPSLGLSSSSIRSSPSTSFSQSLNNVICVGVDDSLVQRKAIRKLFESLGSSLFF